MSRNQKKLVVVNSATGLIFELVSIVCGMILPRLILGKMGSNYNGVTTSITQFLSFITIVRSGIGGVSKVHLYKSLANKDSAQLNIIMRSINKFMFRVSCIYVIGLLLISICYPLLVANEFGWLFSFSLVLIIGISSLFENLLGFSSMILLQADQREYIISASNIIAIILSTVVAAVLINLNSSIHIVKLGSAVVFTLKPVFLYFYTKRKYNLQTKRIKPQMELLNQRKDAVVHAVAEFIHLNTDVVILTAFSNSFEISVYTVYYIIINGLRKLVRSLTSNIEALLGGLHANKDESKFKSVFKTFEYCIFLFSAIIFSCCAVLSEPFVMVYTKGVTDVNYSRPIFAYLIAIAELIYTIRLPYQYVIRVYGKFKDTKWISIGEACLNILISIVLVKRFGVIGISIGTLVAMIFRTLTYSEYVSNKILKYGYKNRICGIILSLLTFLGSVLVKQLLIQCFLIENYFQWCVFAILIFLASTIIAVSFSFLLFKNELLSLKQYIHRKNK